MALAYCCKECTPSQAVGRICVCTRRQQQRHDALQAETEKAGKTQQQVPRAEWASVTEAVVQHYQAGTVSSQW